MDDLIKIVPHLDLMSQAIFEPNWQESSGAAIIRAPIGENMIPRVCFVHHGVGSEIER
jgi:hypothetical protein